MVKVTFIEQDGTRREIEAREGEPLMYAAKEAGIDGIIAECGGAAMCATCHSYLIEAPNGPLPEPEPAEADTIEFNAHEPRENSRLPCQIIVTPAVEGAVFQVATGR
ncbi:MAG: 2Fe-2S iron-sulfur cluster binding domain-containing protein [Maritimibacter sp.]|nr:2Fe-2S iron-sulfur cluster binding domain-containing protein [Maritimibacter sp.]